MFVKGESVAALEWQEIKYMRDKLPDIKHSPTHFMGEAGEAQQGDDRMTPQPGGHLRDTKHTPPSRTSSFFLFNDTATSYGNARLFFRNPQSMVRFSRRLCPIHRAYEHCANIDISTKELSSGAWITRGEDRVATGGPVL